MRIVALIVLLLSLQYGCHHGPNPLQLKLDDAVQRHASIDERIMEWGAPSGKDALSNGRIVYTWKRPWTGNYVNYGVPGGQVYSSQHLCTIVIAASADNTVQSYNLNDC
ncbi:MAG: hypothetical protein HP491_11265 [Nitrospira sp.]|nr:hypothetical protein [Nitrospira sp.]MBH0185626.1 hypothetical protein [Nitrospira sp.]